MGGGKQLPASSASSALYVQRLVGVVYPAEMAGIGIIQGIIYNRRE